MGAGNAVVTHASMMIPFCGLLHRTGPIRRNEMSY